MGMTSGLEYPDGSNANSKIKFKLFSTKTSLDLDQQLTTAYGYISKIKFKLFSMKISLNLD